MIITNVNKIMPKCDATALIRISTPYTLYLDPILRLYVGVLRIHKMTSSQLKAELQVLSSGIA